jgi:hypothetical protein
LRSLFFLRRLMMTNGAACGRADYAMMASHMPGHAANGRARNTASPRRTDR